MQNTASFLQKAVHLSHVNGSFLRQVKPTGSLLDQLVQPNKCKANGKSLKILQKILMFLQNNLTQRVLNTYMKSYKFDDVLIFRF